MSKPDFFNEDKISVGLLKEGQPEYTEPCPKNTVSELHTAKSALLIQSFTLVKNSSKL